MRTRYSQSSSPRALPSLGGAERTTRRRRFDLTIRDHTVTGIVKEFHPANPHTKIVLEVTDEKGTRDVEFEGHSLNNYYRGGWREGLVKVGDKITLSSGTDQGRHRRRLRARCDCGRRHSVLSATR